MRKIAIVGAGQSGLHLAHALLGDGYDVTLLNAQPSPEMRSSRAHITQFTLPSALGLEQRLHLDFWSGQAPRITGVQVGLYPPGAEEPALIRGRLPGAGLAVDRRVKMADWMEFFEDRGGKVTIHGTTVSDLDVLVRLFDLVIVAVGGADLGALFPPDPHRMAGAHPRVLTQVLLAGVEAAPDETASANARSVRGGEMAEVISSPTGRIILAPLLTTQGPAHSLCVMDSPGGALDGSHLAPRRGHPDPAHVAAWIQHVLQQHFPRTRARLDHAEPIDAHAALVATLRPHLRRPVAALPSGGHVLGLADAVVTTDPIAAQGWNTSTLAAAAYHHRIREHGHAPFTPAWMHQTFEAFWNGTGPEVEAESGAGWGQAAALLSHTLHHLWEGPAPAHLHAVLEAATRSPAVADRFIAGLDDPRDYTAWLYDPDAAQAYLASLP